MAKFFNLFPKLVYDTDGNRSGSYDVATNVFVRIGILNTIKNNSSLYYPYLVQEGDTPEMIADKYYGDPEFHWVVLYMNDMVDPFYDWPMEYSNFVRFINNKYGSTVTAQTQVHHYYKQVSRYDSSSQTTTISKMIIDATAYAALPVSQVNTYNLTNLTTVSETVTRGIVYCWDYELERNEDKRSIKLLKKEYIDTVKNTLEQTLNSVPKRPQTVLISTTR